MRARLRSAAKQKLSRVAILLAAAALVGCGGGSSSGGPPPPPVTVSIQPGSAKLFLGQQQQFQASVTGTSNTSVTWSVNSVVGGVSTVGTISSTGLYTAPSILPANSTVMIAATSVADSTASASASVSLNDDIVVTVSPASADVPAGASQLFTAAIAASGSPATGVTWSVNGIAGGNASLGTIVASTATSATYTAPLAPPSPPSVTITAASVADPAKSGSATATVTCTNSISPASASVSLGQTQNFAASLCAASGTPIIWDVNGITGGNSVLGTIAASPTVANAAVYTAPADMCSPDSVAIHATAGAAAASAAVTVTSSVTVSVSPASMTMSPSQRATFTPNIINTPDTKVIWAVNGVLNGSPSVGVICVTASSPCASPNGPASGSVDYLAPAAAPSTNPVTLTATSKADPSQSGSATVLIAAQTGPISATVSPAYAFVAPSGAMPSKFQFFASVSGTINASVNWTVQGAVAGQGCGGAACGSIDANGVYTAPTAAPSPNAVAVTATSLADSTKSGSATVAISSGPTIRVLLPSSVMAGAVESFPFQVQGMNFVAGSGSAASTILLNGVPRNTICASAGACATVLNPSDVQSAATITVQIQNPGAPGALSNPVPFVIVPFDVSTGVVALTESEPVSSATDIVVVEPTTAASSSPIDVDFIGFLASGTCGVQGSPLTIVRPASSTETVSLCVHGNGLDPTFTYAFTGSNGGDIPIAASAVTGLFPNTIELDLTISSATLPGVRSLFITTLNNDRAIATGMLEVK